MVEVGGSNPPDPTNELTKNRNSLAGNNNSLPRHLKVKNILTEVKPANIIRALFRALLDADPP